MLMVRSSSLIPAVLLLVPDWHRQYIHPHTATTALLLLLQSRTYQVVHIIVVLVYGQTDASFYDSAVRTLFTTLLYEYDNYLRGDTRRTRY